jgi:uncharacterized membrane protein (UPF0136 family)
MGRRVRGGAAGALALAIARRLFYGSAYMSFPELVRSYLLVFGVLSIAGGVMGFVKAKSNASLLAGGIAGALLLLAGYLLGTANARAGLILGVVVSVVLAGRFVPSFLKTKKAMPAGLMALLSVVGAVLTVLLLARR